MFDVLKERYFHEHYNNGFVESGITLPDTLVDEIKQHYLAKNRGHNDFPKFFVNNEHQAYLEGRVLGTVLNTFPGFGKKLVKKFYDKAYDKAVYCEQAYVEKVLQYLVDQGFPKFFKTRYMVAAYDMYLRNNHHSPAAGIHTDLPNFHHFYETENDLSIYIPLVDLDQDNGGRLSVLPEAKLRVPGNVLLKLLYEHFSKNSKHVDEKGYVDPNTIGADELSAFAKTKPHQDLMGVYKGATGLAKSQYAGEFRNTTENKGKVLLFSNKNFHKAEPWKNESVDREIYVIRMTPIYDSKIKLNRQLHGALVNNFLVDMEEGTVTRYNEPVDFTRIPDEAKIRL
jgi:hypothetical protein